MIVASTLGDLHQWGAWFVVVANAIAGVWALAAHWIEWLRGAALWVFTAVAQGSIFVQVILGVAAMTTEDLEVEQFHMFYGFIALVTVGLVYSYRQQLAQWRYLLYGGSGLFLMGLAIRAMTLDPVV
ncbi:MAG: hypothetical protein ACR2QE_00845 [Acidimicrobiales bacterium]